MLRANLHSLEISFVLRNCNLAFEQELLVTSRSNVNPEDQNFVQPSMIATLLLHASREPLFAASSLAE